MEADERRPLVQGRRAPRFGAVPVLCVLSLGAVAVSRATSGSASALWSSRDVAEDRTFVLPDLITTQGYVNGPNGEQRMALTWGHGYTPGEFSHETGNMVQGPTRWIPLNSEVRVTLTNALMDTDTSVHHHGIHQVGTPYYDGSTAITQSGLPPGHSMEHAFKAQPYGTHWYHGHTGMQFGDGLKGLFIVTDPEDPYLGRYAVEDALLFYEWMGAATYFGWTVNIQAPFEPDSVWGKTTMSGGLVNGMTSSTPAGDAAPGYVVEVEAGATARLRLCYGGFNFRFHVQIHEHDMTVIAKDGTYLKPVRARKLAVYAAERYDVLVTAADAPGDYPIQFVSFMHGHELGVTGGMNATLRVLPRPLRSRSETETATTTRAAAADARDPGLPTRAIVDLGLVPDALKSHPSLTPAPPRTADRNLTVTVAAGFSTEESQEGGDLLPDWIREAAPDGASQRQFWRINNQSWVDPSAPLYVSKGRYGVYDVSPYDTTQLIHTVAMGEVVDILVVNRGHGSDPMFHPFHLHGYKFWVVAAGKLPIPRDVDKIDYNLDDPLHADTFPVYTGHYAVFRVVFDNPGFWHFHCHLLFHMGLGLQMVFNVAEDDQPVPPASYFAALSPWGDPGVAAAGA